jgi:hypothetical protein
MHDRNAPFLELQQSIVKTTLETKGPEHTDKIIFEVKKRYKVIEQTNHVQDLL